MFVELRNMQQHFLLETSYIVQLFDSNRKKMSDMQMNIHKTITLYDM